MSDYVTRDELEDFANRVRAIGEDAKAHIDRQLAGTRTPSKAHLIGSGYGSSDESDGSFLLAIADASASDAERQAHGKATLAGLSTYQEAWGKASLGTTDATGGWIIPNATVDTLVKPSLNRNLYRELMTVRSGVNSAAVDIPFRSAAPNRAVIAPFGSTKENVDLAYNGYSATMYTLARVHDIGNQFLRQSAGAAEADVLSELGAAFALGEAYYIREGTGTAMPYGFQVAAANMPAAFTTSHTAAAATVAGSVAAAIAKAGAALMGRGRVPEAAVVSALGYSEMLTNGADTAGFFLSGISGPQAVPGLKVGTLVSPWGIPVFMDPDLASDDLYVAEWSAFRIYTGQSFRIDSSSVAGTRWDANLTGFRGEEEIAFDARPAVFAGALQVVADILS